MRRFPAFVFLALLIISSVALAQTTGTVVGVVTDDSGGPLPGVTVEARGPALQGTKVTVTGTDGAYRLTLLPPGSYVVSASLPQFGRAEHTLQVLLDRNVTADFRLRATAREEVVVSGEVPVVDPTSTTLGANIDQRIFQRLPTGRDYGSVVQTVPGVSTDVAEPDSISVYGSSSAENAYLIDGVNTTNLEYGVEGKELNFEFIQEIEVKTGGYEAEYGRSTGGIINVITKSGGNEFHGDAFGYFNDESLQADTKASRRDARGRGDRVREAGLRCRPRRLLRERTGSGSSARTTASSRQLRTSSRPGRWRGRRSTRTARATSARPSSRGASQPATRWSRRTSRIRARTAEPSMTRITR